MNTKFELISDPRYRFVKVPEKSTKQQTPKKLCFEIQSVGGSGAGVLVLVVLVVSGGVGSKSGGRRESIRGRW